MQTSQQLYTFDEYIEDHETSKQHELVNGKLIKLPAPTAKQIKLARFLLMEFGKEIERLDLPWIIGCGDISVRTAVSNCRIPDLTIISDDQEDISAEATVVQSPPILVAEIVGKHNHNTDYRYKRSEYAVRGIPEYWIVDSYQSKITVLTLFEGLYEEQEYVGNQRIISLAFPQLMLSTLQILDA